MTNIHHLLGDINADLLVNGFWNGINKTTQDYAVPGGSMISTGRDVKVFLRALASGNLLSEEEQNTYAELYWFSHSGWLPGYQSIANYEQSLDAVVVLFLNNTGGNSEEFIAETYAQVLRVLRQ